MTYTMPVQSRLAGQTFLIVPNGLGRYDVLTADGSCVRAVTRRAVLISAFGNADATEE